MKKGDLSINMIIVAVIAIVVLVIVIFLLVDTFGNQKKATSCPKNGGICVDSMKCEGGAKISEDGVALTCTDMGQVCCSPENIKI